MVTSGQRFREPGKGAGAVPPNKTMLDDELVVETPERVELRYVLASVGNRFLAAALDHLIQLAVIVALLLLLQFYLSTGLGAFLSNGTWAAALIVLIVFFIIWGYLVVFETLWNGQTPGKRVMGLRVIREDGRPVRFFEAFVRNIIRLVIDFQPIPSFSVGVVSTIFSEKSKRVGDYVAGTVVVKERSTEAPSFDEVLKASELEQRRLQRAGPDPFRIDAKQLNGTEIKALQAFLIRRYDLEEPRRSNMANQIAGSLAAHLLIPDVQMTAEALLEEIDRQYRVQVRYFD
jgi:uncharacterized RDD family membrane protein YckC